MEKSLILEDTVSILEGSKIINKDVMEKDFPGLKFTEILKELPTCPDCKYEAAMVSVVEGKVAEDVEFWVPVEELGLLARDHHEGSLVRALEEVVSIYDQTNNQNTAVIIDPKQLVYKSAETDKTKSAIVNAIKDLKQSGFKVVCRA